MKQDTRSGNSGISPARSAAFDILMRVEREDSYASELLHASSYEHLSTRDHALATELVMGVLRWRSRLDEEIAGVSSQPLAKLDLEILIALRIALYQFRYLDRVPQHAALNESVELIKRARKRSAAPFVNAILRKLSNREFSTDGRQYLSAEILARAYSHPIWLVERWAQEFGLNVARRICDYDQTIPPAAIRLRTPTAEAQLLREGITLARGGILASARLIQSGDITKTEAFRSRQVVIQNEGSQLVAALAARNANTGARILDCCAAPGGKTLALADRNPQATITAVEFHPHRARLLQKQLNLRQSSSADGETPIAVAPIHIVAADARSLPTRISFDRVLADVPCSGTGTLARNPEIKWRLETEDLGGLQDLQCEIVRAALARLASGGRLIYSTCSLEKEENESVVEKIMAQDLSLRVVDCRAELEALRVEGEIIWPDLASLTRGPYLRTIPGIHPCDGFFAAILKKG